MLFSRRLFGASQSDIWAVPAGDGEQIPLAYVDDHSEVGNFETLRSTACTRLRSCHLIEGAGHWVQQEQPERVIEEIVKFLKA